MKHAEQHLRKSIVSAAVDIPFDFSGQWKNELHSSMDLALTAEPDGTLTVTGAYISAESAAGGPTPPFPLHGTVSGDLITWTVNWGIMITTWVGHGVFDETTGAAEILTMWHIIQKVSDEQNPAQQWHSVLTGADQFGR